MHQYAFPWNYGQRLIEVCPVSKYCVGEFVSKRASLPHLAVRFSHTDECRTVFGIEHREAVLSTFGLNFQHGDINVHPGFNECNQIIQGPWPKWNLEAAT